ncbi:hypothetical protein RJ55_03036 [Drechmeria coniospora]|nr:hypothetical protein RJ55_03036 [Drechmeria coniospora]
MDTFTLVFPGDGPSGSRDKDGLRSKSWQKRRSVKMRASKRVLEDPGEYIPLESQKRRKVDQEASDSSGEDDKPSWKTIDIKPKRGRSAVQSDVEDDDSDEDIYETNEDNPMKWKSMQLNKRVKEVPSDIDAWLELVDHQDDLIRAGETIDERATDNAAHSFGEIKVHMLQSALSHTTLGPDRQRVLVRLMGEGVKIWDHKMASKKWSECAEEETHCFSLWKTHLNFIMSSIVKVDFDGVQNMLLDRLRAVRSRSGLQALDDVEEAIYIFLRATRFLHDAGYKERSVAAWQALLELSLLRHPDQELGHEKAMQSFGDFWESEVPRLGDENSQGWKRFVESGGKGEPLEPAKDEPVQNPMSRDAFMAWGVVERSWSRKAGMPARTLDEGMEDDPFRVVTFPDIEPWLFVIPDDKLPDATPQLVDAFLLFCGMPSAFSSKIYTDTANDDTFLTGANTSIQLQPAWEAAQDGSEEWQRKDPVFSSGNCRALISPNLLFSGTSWFQYLSVVHRELGVDIAFLQRMLKQLVLTANMATLGLYYLGVCYAREPTAIKKPAKALLQKFSTDAELYSSYALAELANENTEVAKRVLLSAAESPSIRHVPTASLLFQTWSWTEFSGGNRGAAANRLCACVDDSLLKPILDDGGVSPSVILKAQRAFSSSVERFLYEENLNAASVNMQCLVLLSYLTSRGGTEPSSASQGNITAAMGVIETMTSKFPALRHERGAALESLLQFSAMLLYHHALKGPFRRAYLRDQLARFVDAFPRNTIFLTLFEWADTSIRVVDETRHLLYDKVLVKARDSVGGRVFAVEHELTRGNINSTKAAFEHAVSSDVCRSSVALWIAYLRFCHSQQQLRPKAKDVFYRALRCCPWSKEVMMEAFVTLVDEMQSGDLRSVYSTMIDKGVRIHVDMEDFVSKWHEERRGGGREERQGERR